MPKPGYKMTELGELPAEWEVVRLGDVVTFKNGARPPSVDKGDIPIYGANGIMGFTFEPLVNNDYTLIVGRVGASGEIHLAKGEIWISDNAIYSYTYDSNVYLPYLYYAMIRSNLKKYATKTTHPIITQTFLNNFKLPLPPLPEQRRIAKVLSTVDEAIEKTDEMIAHAERLKKGLMQRLLTQGIGHEKFKDSEIGRIPAEWEVVRLGDVAKLKSGGTPNRNKPEYWKDGTVPWVRSGELNDGVIYDTEEKITNVGLKDSSAKIFPKGTLVIALYGRGTVSKTAILGIDAATNQAVAAIIPINSRFYPKFMQYYLIHSRSKLLNQSVNPSSDVGRTNIYLGSLKFFKLPLPSLEEQKKIAEILGTVDRKLERLRVRRERLERVKKGLMNDLLTGRKRVPEGVM